MKEHGHNPTTYPTWDVFERDCYRAALERIAGQGIGRWDPNAQCTVGNTGEPWKHWATIAKEALKRGSPSIEMTYMRLVARVPIVKDDGAPSTMTIVGWATMPMMARKAEEIPAQAGWKRGIGPVYVYEAGEDGPRNPMSAEAQPKENT